MTLDGTVIHKNGLITGGEGVSSAKQWEERELEGKVSLATVVNLALSFNASVDILFRP